MEVELRDGLYGFEFRDVDRRRVDPDRRVGRDIKQLWQRSHEIINLSAKGFKNSVIAEILNLDPSTVSQTLNSTLGKHKLSELRKERDEETKATIEKIRVITDKALNVYHEFFDDDSGEVTLRLKREAARDFLNDLSGLKAPTRIQSHSIYTELTPQELEEFRDRGLKAAKERGVTIDVTPESEEES